MEHPRFITLTLAPPEWDRRRAQMRDLARRIRATGAQCEWIWTTELGSRTGMCHVHAIQHGDYLPQRELQQLWGGRRVDIRSARPEHGAYISKGASAIAHYLGKGSVTDLETALALNNGRLHHWSRGFYGQPIRLYEKLVSHSDDSDCLLVFAPELRSTH